MVGPVDLSPVRRRSASDGVFEQLVDRLLSGEVAPGQDLPAERVMTEALGVNRQAVREALKRLAQAGLVRIHQGEPTKALDYRRSANLDLLARLLFTTKGTPDARVIRSIMEMRASIGPDAARHAASRASVAARDNIVAIAQEMRDTDDLASLAKQDLRFWEAIIDASDNIAYRLAFNSLRDTYEPMSSALSPLFASELSASHLRLTLAGHISRDRSDEARDAASQLLALGTAAINEAFASLEAKEQKAR